MNSTPKNSFPCNLDIAFSRQGKYVLCHEELDSHFGVTEVQHRNAGIVAVQEACNSLTCTDNLVLLPLDTVVLACKSPGPVGNPKTKQPGKPMKKMATPKVILASRMLASAQQQGDLGTSDAGTQIKIKEIQGISPSQEALQRQGYTGVQATHRHDGASLRLGR